MGAIRGAFLISGKELAEHGLPQSRLFRTDMVHGEVQAGRTTTQEVNPCQRNQKRPCSHPGCPRLTDGRFCEEHAKAEAKRYEKYDRDPCCYAIGMDRLGSVSVTAMYSNTRYCEQCQEQVKLDPTEEVHHKVSFI